MDLMGRFEQATSGGPEHRAIKDRLAVGRRANARRRASLAAGATAAVLAVAGVVWTVQPAGDSVSGEDIVASDAGSVERDSGAPDSPTSTPAPPTVLFRYDLDTAALEVADGVTVVRQVDNPVPNRDITSAAAVVDYKGERRWVMAAVVRGRSSWGSDIEATSSRSFEQWVHELTVLNTAQMFSDGAFDSGWVTLDINGGFAAHKGATIVEQSTPARIDQAPADVPSAAGTIDVDGALTRSKRPAFRAPDRPGRHRAAARCRPWPRSRKRRQMHRLRTCCESRESHSQWTPRPRPRRTWFASRPNGSATHEDKWTRCPTPKSSR